MTLSNLLRLCSIVVLTSALVDGAPVSAQEADARQDASRDAAREAFTRGREAYNAERYDEALAAYSEAIELRDHPALRMGAAQSLFQLTRYREALAQLDAAAASAEADETTRAQVSELRRLASEQVGRLIIRTPGATDAVRIEGLDDCSPPCDLSLDPGAYTVAGTDREPQTIEIAARETVRLVLSVEETVVERDLSAPSSTREWWEPGPLFYVGLGLSAVGAAGGIAFGVLTLDLDDEWQRDGCSIMPTVARCIEVQDQGTLFGALTTVSIATGGVGLVMLLIDLLVSRRSALIEADVARRRTLRF